MGNTQETGALTGALNTYKMGKVRFFCFQFFGDNRTKTRMDDTARWRISRVQEVSGSAMIAFGARQGANDGQLISFRCNTGPMFGNLDSRNRCWDGFGGPLRGGPRFRIKGFKLARTAGHPQEDAGFAGLAEFIRLQVQPIKPRQTSQTKTQALDKSAATDDSARAHLNLQPILVLLFRNRHHV